MNTYPVGPFTTNREEPRKARSTPVGCGPPPSVFTKNASSVTTVSIRLLRR